MSGAEWIAENWPALVVGPDVTAWERGCEDAPRMAGVYFLWGADGLLLYIGHSDDISYRTAQHVWAGVIPFAAYSAVEIDPAPHPFGLVAREIEACYIHALAPPMNAHIPDIRRPCLRQMADAIRAAWAQAEDGSRGT